MNKNSTYIYNALGVKLIKRVSTPQTQNETVYSNGFQYQDTKLQYFPTAEGYVSVLEGKINYVYNYTDHLGNVRLSYGLDPEVQGQLKILSENHYYPYGLKHSNYNAIEYAYKENELGTYVILEPTDRQDYRYKYNGMEYQDELGLNLYDMDFRDYDPAIARWTGIDPVTHHNMSPYMAFDGNPVFWADPSGADAYDMAMALFNNSRSGMTQYSPTGNGGFQQSGYIPDDFFTGSFMSSSIDEENHDPPLRGKVTLSNKQIDFGKHLQFRHLFGPDAIMIAGTQDANIGLGIGFEQGVIIVLRGPDKGIYPAYDFGVGVGGVSISAGLEFVKLYYSGDDVRAKYFYGKRYEVNLSAEFMGKAGITGIFANVGNGYYVLGYGASLGVGFSATIFTGNGNYGSTSGLNPGIGKLFD